MAGTSLSDDGIVRELLTRRLPGELLAFFSKKLTPRQTTWPAYYRELLAVYDAVQHFRHVLEAQHVTINPDHKPLIYAFLQRYEKLPPPQLNQLSFFSQFITDILHVKGQDNVVSFPGTKFAIICDTSRGKARPFIPRDLRRAIFKRLHKLSHPGTRATTKLVTDRYWTRSCLDCQRCKITRHISTPVGTFTTPTQRFRHVHVDILGPLPHSKGFQYCLTTVDTFTR
ncbi:hypothetical protein K1T71_007349 [Dendrolimus kikuchii]|uniref:Uncharacterized protein n=1 Tax=Dendrolimus kikuchii TaxID=765133 RepID=A0ACC1D0I5_9NEOP|nr:hypothetical protein K1T71_007349 [Dendrolimus kikuchii]